MAKPGSKFEKQLTLFFSFGLFELSFRAADEKQSLDGDFSICCEGNTNQISPFNDGKQCVTFPLNVSNMIFIFPQSLSIICLFQTCLVDHFVCWFFDDSFYNHINLTDEKRKYYMKIFNEISTTVIYKPDFADYESSPTSAIVFKSRCLLLEFTLYRFERLYC